MVQVEANAGDFKLAGNKDLQVLIAAQVLLVIEQEDAGCQHIADADIDQVAGRAPVGIDHHTQFVLGARLGQRGIVNGPSIPVEHPQPALCVEGRCAE